MKNINIKFVMTYCMILSGFMLYSISMNAQYCVPSGGTSCATDNTDEVLMPDIGLNNTDAGCLNLDAPGYSDFTDDPSVYDNDVSGVAVEGEAFSFTTSNSGTFAQHIKIWIDLDGNGEFDPVGDLVYESSATSVSHSGTITIPCGSAIGMTTMRVMNRWLTPPVGPCEIGSVFGEAHDYALEIVAGSACECEISCPDDVVVDNDPGECGAFVGGLEAELDGICDNGIDITNSFNDSENASDFYPVGTTTIEYSTNIAAVGTCEFTVTVNDTEPPTVACPSDIQVSLNAGECARIVEYNVDVTDNCPFIGPSGAVFTEDALDFPSNAVGGVSFDIANDGTTPLEIEGFRLPFSLANTRTVEVWYTTTASTHAGNMGNQGAWTLMGEQTLAVMLTPVLNPPFPSVDEFTQVDIGGLVLQPGESKGIYIRSEPGSIRYTGTGAAFNPIPTATDGNLTVISNGVGMTNWGATPFDPRAFVGEVQYSSAVTGGDAELISGLPSGSEFEVGTTENCFEAEDNAGNTGTCCFNVTVNDFPNVTSTLACNDLVNISIDENCELNLNAGMILEGGPYGCLDDYELIIENMDGDIIDNIGAGQIGQEFIVTVLDPFSDNECWGKIFIEDKINPTIECRDLSVDCGALIPEEPAPAFDGELFSIAYTGLNDFFGNAASGAASDEVEYEFDFSGFDDDFTVNNVRLRVNVELLRPHNNSIILQSPDGTSQTIYNATTFNAAAFTLDVTFDDNGQAVTAYDQFDVLSGGAPVLPINGTIAAGAGPVFFNFDGENAAGIWTVRFETTFASTITEASGEVFEVELLLEVDAPRIEASDNCGDVELDFVDNVQNFDLCDEIPTVISRNWTATDHVGNTASCVQTIEIHRTGLEELTLPGDAVLNCTQNFATDDQGNPHPSVTGEPGLLCENVLGTYTDIVIDDCPGTTKILRKWILVDWCTAEDAEFTQVIKVQNNTSPTIECLPSHEVSTQYNTCEGSWDATLESLFAQGAIDALPEDACSDDVTYTVTSSAGSVNLINGNWIVSGLPVGTHQVTYTADDGCGNETECVTNLSVVDDVAPVAVCDLDTRVSLGGGTQGFARVFVEAFDDGSWDNCGVESILVRRSTSDSDFSTNSQCGNDQVEWQPYMDFCCADIEQRGGEIPVYVQVTDLSGNTNVCSVTVYVEDNVAPSITCPSDLDITVNCLFDFGGFDFSNPNTDASQAALDELFGGIVRIQQGEDRVTRVINPAALPQDALPEVTVIDGFAIDNCPMGLEIDQEIFIGVEEACNNTGTGVQVTPTQERIVFGQTTPQQRQGFEMDGDLAIVRGWRATDAYGNETLDCVQQIKVVNTRPFSGIDNFSGLPPSQWEIVWPGDQTLGICTDGTGLDPDDSGRPQIQGPNLGCADILISYNDEIFTGSEAGDACLKVLRTWKVIDWCQPETIQQPWSHIQQIKVMNADAPIVTNCEDVTFEFSGATGCSGNVEDFVLEVEHACIEEDLLEEALTVTYQIDAFNTGSFDISGSGFDASGEYPFGEHRIVWTVSDPCGNVTVCEHLFTVADLKEPTPVCFNGIATVVMPSTGAISLTADFFDAGSFDNCGDVELEIWSDGTALTEDDPINYEEEWTWTCEDLDGASELTFEVRILAIDQFGNSDWCETYVLIQDNMNVCPDTAGGTSLISGLVANEQGDGVEKVDMDLSSVNGGFAMNYQTESAGSFSFSGVPMGQEYELSGTRTDNPLNGVTTYDIALIQRHILGTHYLDNPYKLIAADVNNDGQINVVDIAQLRRLILGTYDEFPNNDSWKVIVDEDLEMGIKPPAHQTMMDLGMVNRDLHDNNFIGVKIGDVNASHSANGLMSSSERSLAEALELRIADQKLIAGEQVVVEVTSENAEGLFGYQGTMHFDNNSLEFVGYESGAISLSDANFGFHLMSEGLITTSWSETEALEQLRRSVVQPCV
jgi:hypothetical protein